MYLIAQLQTQPCCTAKEGKPEVNCKTASEPQACVTMPFYECQEGIYEIDEFDCASIFVVVGEARALVIDTGIGIGDLKWLIENRITDKPYDVVLTHNHVDHMGGAAWFDRVYIHPDDMVQTDTTASPTLALRRSFAELFRVREHRHYLYDAERDIRPWPRQPVLVPLRDGQRFDLGGRTVTAYHCPGHTPGEMIFIDDRTRTLLCGDALNEFFLLSSHLAPTKEARAGIAAAGLARMKALSDQYDRIYNFHHDYRGYGAPLADDVLDSVLACLRQIQNGTASYVEQPDPLSAEPKVQLSARYGRIAISSLMGKINED